MVHVWQHQLGYPVRLRGALRVGLPYHYALREGATLADYFMLKHRRQPDAMRQQHYRDSLVLYESVLAGFLADPASRANLHRGLARRLVRAPV
jgi:hypothetical protein